MARSAFGAIVLLAISPLAIAGDYRAQFDVETTDGAGSFVIAVHEDWAPLAAKRFRELVEAEFFDDTRFYRVIPTFLAQFGLNGDPNVTKHWRKQRLLDEPVLQSNQPGYVSFGKTAAKDSRYTQVFINYVNSAFLDKMGFSPFALVEGNGMEVVKKIYDCQEKPHQPTIIYEGNKYLDKEFPELSKIIRVRIVEDSAEEKAEL